MSTWIQLLQAAATLIGLGLTFAGLIALVVQVRKLTAAIHSETHAHLTAHSFDLLRFMADLPRCYPHFYENRPLPEDDPQRIELLLLAEAIANYLDNVVQQRANLPPLVWERWRVFTLDTIAASPVLRDHLDRHAAWYSNELIRLLRRAAP